jgi:hypothetical protein
VLALGLWTEEGRETKSAMAMAQAQGAPKKEKKRRKKRRTYLYAPTYLFLRFFEIFRADFRKYFYGAFGLLKQRNGQKRDKRKIEGKSRQICFFLNFFGQRFLTWALPKRFFMVFLNSPC